MNYHADMKDLLSYFMLSGALIFTCGNACGDGTKNQRKNVPKGSPAGESITSKATGAISLTGGGAHMCAILDNHQLRCWGYDEAGELNLVSATNASNKRFDVSQAQFSYISVSGNHSCGLLKGGELDKMPVCFGQEGEWLKVPQEKMRSIAPGSDFTCFVKENGSLGCVGDKIRIYSASSGPQQEIKAEDLPKYGITPGSGVEYIDFSTKSFKSVKATQHGICAMGDDDMVYCMGSNMLGMGKSIQQKAIDYAPITEKLNTITDDGKFHEIEISSSSKAAPNLGDPKRLKYKKVFYSFNGILGILTDAGNSYDDGTALPENTLVMPNFETTLIQGVVDMASNRGGLGKSDLYAYCVLKTNHKVTCVAIAVGGANNPDSLIVKDIPPEIRE
jgi:alpha-tubulin suppressor-like RCC1 family protein